MNGAQKKLSSLWRTLSIESYVVFAISLIAFFFVHIVDAHTHRWDIPFDPRLVLTGPIAGHALLQSGTLVILLYGGFLLVRYLRKRIPKKLSVKGITLALDDPRLVPVSRSALYWFVMLSSFIIGSSAVFPALFKNFSWSEMVQASNMLMYFDKTLFGVHVPFWLHTLQMPDLLETLLAGAYTYMPLALGLMFAYLCFTDTKGARIYFLTLAVATYLSVPFWIALPAIPPNEIYRLNIFELTLSEESKAEIAQVAFSPAAERMLGDVERMWFDPAMRSFSVSSFPSTHVIWAMLFLYASYARRKQLGYAVLSLVSLFVLANLIATMFLLEHYAVDVVLGIIVAGISISIAHRLLWLEDSYFEDRFELFAIFDAIRTNWR